MIESNCGVVKTINGREAKAGMAKLKEPDGCGESSLRAGTTSSAWRSDISAT